MIKVMYISHASTLGGAEQSLIDILKYIKERICPIVILPKNGAMEDILNDINVKYYIHDYPQTKNIVGNKDAKQNAYDFIRSYDVALELAEIIKTQQIDLVHTNSTVVDVGALAATIAEKPHIWHFRELMEEDFNIEYQNKTLKKYLFQNSVKCISISDCVYEKYRNTYHVESIKINNGIDSARFSQKIENKKLNSKEFYVAGHVSRNKGQMDAIKAIEILVNEGYAAVKLYIVGSMTKQDKWSLSKYINERGLAKNIQFGDFSYSLDALRKRCLCSITTSKMEALGRVTVEAMLAGNIVIGANTGGTAEIIGQNNEHGFLYEQGNEYDLAKKMKVVMGMSEDDRIKLVMDSQKYAKEKFDAVAYSSKLLGIYEEAINEYKKSDILQEKIAECYKLAKLEKYEDVDVSENSVVETIFKKMKDKKYVSNLVKKRISHLAVYGIGKIGMELLDNLEDTGIHLDYVIDQRENFLSFNYDYYKPYDELPPTQAIVITAKNASEISAFYKDKYQYEIIGIEELV